MGIKLVFVMEGEAPELKAETMGKRTLARYGAVQKSGGTGRGRFRAVLKEVSPESVTGPGRGLDTLA